MIKMVDSYLLFLKLLQLLIWSDTAVLPFKSSLTLFINGLEVHPVFYHV